MNGGVVRALPWYLLALAVIGVDQATKLLAEASLELYRPVAVMPYFNITLAYNEGAAFSFLADAGGWQRWFFTVLALVVSSVLAVWLARLPSHQRVLALALALVLGGAVGNLIDRVAYGHVIDFLDFYVGDWHWPAFNIADSSIFVGAALLIFHSLFLEDRDEA